MSFGLKDLGANIRRIRRSRPSRIKPGKPMLQRELAALSHIPASSLCNIENGKYKNPTWEILSKVAEGLGCEISHLFAEPERPVSPSQIAINEIIEMIIRERLESILKESQLK